MVKRREAGDKIIIAFQVSADVYKSICDYCDKTDDSLSRVCRGALFKHLAFLRGEKDKTSKVGRPRKEKAKEADVE